ncbi:MAG: hypothetical protein WBC91_17750 [Phototrophicaceae bacterium]
MVQETIHENQEMLTYGAELAEAQVAVLLMHGRGARAESMLDLAKQLPADGVAYVMPQASENRWYPNSGFAPFAVNQPDLASAWNTMTMRLQAIQDAGIPLQRIVVGGFSQGACLASEYVAQHADVYGGLLVLSGALMGDEATPRDYEKKFAGTPVFVGGANQDSWMTEQQLITTAEIFASLGADVVTKIHDSSEHIIRPSDIEHATRIITAAKDQ